MQVHSSSKGSAVSLSRATVSVSSVGTFVNKLTTSKLTIWSEWMKASLILSTKWAEFLTYDEDLPVSGLMISTRKRLNGWHAEPRLLTIGLNEIPSLWIFGVHIYVVACCKFESAVCILFLVWEFYSYQGSVTASFQYSGSGLSLLYNSHHCQSRPPEYCTLPIATVVLPLSAGSIMMLLLTRYSWSDKSDRVYQVDEGQNIPHQMWQWRWTVLGTQ